MQSIRKIWPLIKRNRIALDSKRFGYSPYDNHRRSISIATYFILAVLLVLVGCKDTASLHSSSVDTFPPSVPEGLVATVLSVTQIRISWQASTDDTGVSRYRVLRNGEYIGVTNSTIFLDAAANAHTSPQYSVIAVDAADNASPVSQAISGFRLQAAHSQPY